MMFERSGAYSRRRFVEEIRCAAHRNPFPCEQCRSRWRREARLVKAVAWFVGVCAFGFVAGVISLAATLMQP